MTRAVAKSQWLPLGVLSAALLLGLAGCSATPSAPSAPAAGSAQYRVMSQQPGDGITIEDATQDVTIDITSEKGIGSTEILRRARRRRP